MGLRLGSRDPILFPPLGLFEYSTLADLTREEWSGTCNEIEIYFADFNPLYIYVSL